MSTFPKLQRNSFIKDLLKNFGFLVFYIFYIALSSIYALFPPLLGVLFAKYIKDYKEANFLGLFVVFSSCLLFEVQKANMAGIMFLLFVFLGVVVGKIVAWLDEENILFGVVYVILPYIGYFFASQCLGILSAQRSVSFDLWVLWYIIAEALVVIWKR